MPTTSPTDRTQQKSEPEASATIWSLLRGPAIGLLLAAAAGCGGKNDPAAAPASEPPRIGDVIDGRLAFPADRLPTDEEMKLTLQHHTMLAKKAGCLDLLESIRKEFPAERFDSVAFKAGEAGPLLIAVAPKGHLNAELLAKWASAVFRDSDLVQPEIGLCVIRPGVPQNDATVKELTTTSPFGRPVRTGVRVEMKVDRPPA